MALHGSACANLSPILFKGNNRSLGVNIIIQRDVSGSMNDVNDFYGDGVFIEKLQYSLLDEEIGTDIEKYPNLYATFDVNPRNPNNSFNIRNINGELFINQAFMVGLSSAIETKDYWVNNYWTNVGRNIVVDICTNVEGETTDAGRLLNFGDETSGGSPKSEDVHGSLWSIWTTPNAISTGIPGRYGSILGSNVRRGTTTIIITNSDEQNDSPSNMINVPVNVGSNNTRTINGQNGEMIRRGYRIIGLHSYNSSDGYDGVLFYGSSSLFPYGYVTFTSNTTYEILPSTSPPNWFPASNQRHNMITLASETRGAIFKINNVFTNSGVDRREAFANVLTEFIANTV